MTSLSVYFCSTLKPRKSNVSGLPSPLRSRFCSANRPNSIRRVLSGWRFGLHNLRHSLSNWLVNKAKIQPKTVQGILRHSDVRTTLNLYTQNDADDTRTAQGQFLSAVGLTGKVQ